MQITICEIMTMHYTGVVILLPYEVRCICCRAD